MSTGGGGKSWFQRARAQTLRTKGRERGNASSSSMADTSGGNVSSSNDTDGETAQASTPMVGKTLTDFLYKPATVRGLPTMLPEVVNAYNLDWWELEAYLKQIYPGVTFKENLAVEDHYLIYVPRLLTSEERDKINEIRKQHRRRRRSATTNVGGLAPARAEHSPDGPRRPMDEDD